MSGSESLKLLKMLRRVMTEVKEAELELYMPQYYKNGEQTVSNSCTIHTCGGPACVLGYCALDQEFKKEFGFLKFGHQVLSPIYLWQEARYVFEGDHHEDLIESIATGTPALRQKFTDIRSNFIINEEPTTADAIEYLTILIDSGNY